VSCAPRPTALALALALVLCLTGTARAEDAPGGAASGAAPSAGAGRDEASDAPTWYAQAFSHGPGGINITHFWSKGPYLRAETIISGHKIVTIVKDEWYYAYDASRANGIRVRRTEAARALDAPYRRPFGRDAIKLIKQGAEKIRDEKFLGRDTEVYQLTDRRGRRTVWVTKDALNIPLRIELYSRKTAATQVTDYTDWLTGLTLPDRYFEPDHAVLIESYELEEYAAALAKHGVVGPVPVLYDDLLRGP
jgi:hypothetical protein